jgi:hypothetical protein
MNDFFERQGSNVSQPLKLFFFQHIFFCFVKNNCLTADKKMCNNICLPKIDSLLTDVAEFRAKFLKLKRMEIKKLCCI